jgi:tetratricopeptide (TPR) repeat protein
MLGILHKAQGRLGEAEQMYTRALRGYKAPSSVCVQQYLPALNTLQNMGDLYAKQDEIAKAHAMYARALSRLTSVLSQSSERCISLAAKMDALPYRETSGHALRRLIYVQTREVALSKTTMAPTQISDIWFRSRQRRGIV